MTQPVPEPPKTEHVEQEVSKESVVSEQMWRMVWRKDETRQWRFHPRHWLKQYPAERMAAACRRRGDQARAVRVTVFVDTGQLPQKETSHE